jgi:NAD(P)-dependent dehydrogenase (short-subunit alcohol dehydrogenase family)
MQFCVAVLWIAVRACAEQDAAAVVEQAHPGGIDVLVANAGMGGVSDLSTLNIDL